MYQCPNCGGGLRFDILTQKMKCDYCQTTVEPSAFRSFHGAEEETEFEVTKFICTQCGGEIISQDNTAAAFCSFCGASTLLTSRLSREMRPDAIIPFKKTKEDCIASYRKMMNRAVFAPKELKDENCINSFRGIYMPYWVYDVSHKGFFRLCGTKSSRSGDYDITRYYDLTGEINADYQGITHDAAKEFSDDISESLAPYNIREMQHFNAAYLSGFYADTFDVISRVYDEDVITMTSDFSFEQAKSVPNFKGYQISQKSPQNASPFPTAMDYPHYALFPVWFMSYRKGNRVAYVSINGQTGKISADLPVDYKKYAIGSVLLAIPIFIFFNFIVSMKASTAMVTAMIIAVITLFISFREISKIIRKDSGVDDKGLQSTQSGQQKIKKPKFSDILHKRWEDKIGIAGMITSICAVLLSLNVLILDPVSDYFYYGGAALSIAAVFLTIIDIMRHFNILSTRKLPQFSREGGDDRAR